MVEGTNRRWLLARRPTGTVGPDNFRWSEGPIPRVEEGKALVRNLWLSFDPTQYLLIAHDSPSSPVQIGGAMSSIAVAQVVESRLPGFAPGDLVHGHFAWEDYTLTDGSGFLPMFRVAPGVPPNLALGVLGYTGMAAYFGLLEIGRPKAGETFVVSAAAGGVGSIAGQIAKIHGMRAIGIAGGKQKCDWLVKELGFDGAIDHRAGNVGAELGRLCPDGIDVYFDNVGGPILDEALAHLRRKGRVVICGITSLYTATTAAPGPSNYTALVMERGRMEGFFAADYVERFPEARTALTGWLSEGRLKSREDVVEGLEKAPETLARMFTGSNVGKQLLRIADPG